MTEKIIIKIIVKCFLSVHSPTDEMSEEEMRDKALASARMALGGKTEIEKAAILHQHMGSRAMSDMVIETLMASSG